MAQVLLTLMTGGKGRVFLFVTLGRGGFYPKQRPNFFNQKPDDCPGYTSIFYKSAASTGLSKWESRNIFWSLPLHWVTLRSALVFVSPKLSITCLSTECYKLRCWCALGYVYPCNTCIWWIYFCLFLLYRFSIFYPFFHSKEIRPRHFKTFKIVIYCQLFLK